MDIVPQIFPTKLPSFQQTYYILLGDFCSLRYDSLIQALHSLIYFIMASLYSASSSLSLVLIFMEIFELSFHTGFLQINTKSSEHFTVSCPSSLVLKLFTFFLSMRFGYVAAYSFKKMSNWLKVQTMI